MRTSSSLKISGGYDDDTLLINQGAKDLNLVGKGQSPHRVVSVYDNLVVNRALYVPNNPNVVEGPIFALTKTYFDVECRYYLGPSYSDHFSGNVGRWPLVESGNPAQDDFRPSGTPPANIMYSFGFSPGSSPSESITWNWARLIWRGVALDNTERDFLFTIHVNTDFFSDVVFETHVPVRGGFYVRSFGNSRGFSTNVSPWFRPQSFTLATIWLYMSSTLSNSTYRFGRMWVQFKA